MGREGAGGVNAKPESDGAVIQFSKKVTIIVQAVLAVLSLTAVLGGALAWWLMRPIAAEAQARSTADSLNVVGDRYQDARLDRLTRIAELQATFTLEPPGSPERARALAEFRQMRRLVP